MRKQHNLFMNMLTWFIAGAGFIISLMTWPPATIVQALTSTATPAPVRGRVTVGIPTFIPTYVPQGGGGRHMDPPSFAQLEAIKQALEALPNAERGQSIPVPFTHLSIDMSQKLCGYHLDAFQKNFTLIDEKSIVGDANGNFIQDVTIPTDASGGTYYWVTGNIDDCASETVFDNLATNNLQGQRIELPPLIDNIAIKVAPDTKQLDVDWQNQGINAQDNVQVVWSHNGQKLAEHNTNVFSNLELFSFLKPDVRGTEFYAPTLANQVAPGVYRVYPNLERPPLAAGTYDLEIYVNGVMEGNESVKVP